MTNVLKKIPGAADQSAAVCELQRPIDTAAGHWARGPPGWGWGMLSEMLELYLESSKMAKRGQ